MSSTGLVNLNAFKGGALAAFAPRMVNMPAPISDVLGQGFAPEIRYRGKDWYLKYKGEEHPIRDQEGGLAREITLVVLRHPGRKSRNYFGPGTFDAKAAGAPLCSSLDGQKPDRGKEIQADNCALCKHSVWGKQPNGRDGRACQEYLRLAVFLHPLSQQGMFPADEYYVKPIYLKVPPASMKSFSAMEDQMLKMGFPTFAYYTVVSFKPGLTYPQLEFTATDPIKSESEAAHILELLDDPDVKRITGETEVVGGMKVVAQPAPQIRATPAQFDFTKIKQVRDTDTTLAPQQPITIEATANPTPTAAKVAKDNWAAPKLPSAARAADLPVDDDDLPPADADMDDLIGGMLNALKG